MKDQEPWLKPDGERSAFPHLTAQYQPRTTEQVVREEIKRREESD